jgi:hypothetical protein
MEMDRQREENNKISRKKFSLEFEMYDRWKKAGSEAYLNRLLIL